MTKPRIDPADDKFGTILNCAVRYAIGRETYMPSLVIGYIRPLLPYLSPKTLYVLDRDITEQRYRGGYGASVDEADWMQFLLAIHKEQDRRGCERYKDGRKGQDEHRTGD